MASIGFIGVGKLGQACAEMVAEVHDVVGYDLDILNIDTGSLKNYNKNKRYYQICN